MWGNFTVCQGVEIDKELQSVDYPVVLGRRITVTPYQGIFLSTRMDSGVEVNPFRKRAEALKEWCQTQDRGGLTAAYTVASICEDISTSSITGTKKKLAFGESSNPVEDSTNLPPSNVDNNYARKKRPRIE
nr:replication protein A 70 kDa DNA-binding subunit B-like [Ipomoea batatas]